MTVYTNLTDTRDQAAVNLQGLLNVMGADELPDDISTATDAQLAAAYVADFLEGSESDLQLTEGAIAIIQNSIAAARANVGDLVGMRDELQSFRRANRGISTQDIVDIANALSQATTVDDVDRDILRAQRDLMRTAAIDFHGVDNLQGDERQARLESIYQKLTDLGLQVGDANSDGMHTDQDINRALGEFRRSITDVNGDQLITPIDQDARLLQLFYEKQARTANTAADDQITR